MCISAAMLTAMAAGTAAVGTIYGIDQQRKAAHGQMDQARDAQAKADTMATQTANARLAQRRRALSANSLVTDSSTSGMASAGRATLGGA